MEPALNVFAPLNVFTPLNVFAPMNVFARLSNGTFRVNRASAKLPVVIFAASKSGMLATFNTPLTLAAVTEPAATVSA